MDSYAIYKSFYDREIGRRKDLDNAINMPVTLLTLIVGINSFYIDSITLNDLRAEHVFLVLIVCFFLMSIFFVIKSYNNLFRGFSYRNLGYASEIRNYETIEIPEYNNHALISKEEELNFEVQLIDKLTDITDNHIKINDQRSMDLYATKANMIIALILSGIEVILLILNTI